MFWCCGSKKATSSFLNKTLEELSKPDAPLPACVRAVFTQLMTPLAVAQSDVLFTECRANHLEDIIGLIEHSKTDITPEQLGVYSPHAISYFLLYFCRQLPEAVIPSRHYIPILRAVNSSSLHLFSSIETGTLLTILDRVSYIRSIIISLPLSHQLFLKSCCELFSYLLGKQQTKLPTPSESNHFVFTSSNLSFLLLNTILRSSTVCRSNDEQKKLHSLEQSSLIFLISHYQFIFMEHIPISLAEETETRLTGAISKRRNCTRIFLRWKSLTRSSRAHSLPYEHLHALKEDMEKLMKENAQLVADLKIHHSHGRVCAFDGNLRKALQDNLLTPIPSEWKENVDQHAIIAKTITMNTSMEDRNPITSALRDISLLRAYDRTILR